MLHLARDDLPSLAVPSMCVTAIRSGTVAMPHLVFTWRAAVKSGEARCGDALLALDRTERVAGTERGHGALTGTANATAPRKVVDFMMNLPEAMSSRKRRRAQVELGLGQGSNSASLPREVTRSLPSCRSIAQCIHEGDRAPLAVQPVLLLQEMTSGRGFARPQAHERKREEQPVQPPMTNGERHRERAECNRVGQRDAGEEARLILRRHMFSWCVHGFPAELLRGNQCCEDPGDDHAGQTVVLFSRQQRRRRQKRRRDVVHHPGCASFGIFVQPRVHAVTEMAETMM